MDVPACFSDHIVIPENFLDPVLGCAYAQPVRLTECQHVVDGIFRECRETLGLHNCPVEGCSGSTKRYTNQTDLQQEMITWFTDYPELLEEQTSILKNRVVSLISDPITKLPFAKIILLSCDHFLDEASLDHLRTLSITQKCPICEDDITFSDFHAELPEIQRNIDAFIRKHSRWLGITIRQNKNNIASTLSTLSESHLAEQKALSAITQFKTRPQQSRFGSKSSSNPVDANDSDSNDVGTPKTSSRISRAGRDDAARPKTSSQIVHSDDRNHGLVTTEDRPHRKSNVKNSCDLLIISVLITCTVAIMALRMLEPDEK